MGVSTIFHIWVRGSNRDGETDRFCFQILPKNQSDNDKNNTYGAENSYLEF